MRKLLGLFSVCALVGVAAGVTGAEATPPSGQFSSTEYGRAQQVENAKVIASSNYDVESSTYTVAPGGNTGWRTGPGTTALAVAKGALKVEQAEGCASRDLPAGKSLVLPRGKFRLLNAGQEPVELLVNFTDLPLGGGSPLVDGPAAPAPSCAGFAAAAAPNGVSAGKSFRGDVTPYFQQAHAGHGGGDTQGGYPTKELSIEAGKDTFMGTFTLQPGFSTGWFTHTDHVAILTKGTWAFYEARDGKCEKVEEYRAGDAWVHHVHRHLGAVQGNEPAEITLFGFNMRHGDPMPVFDSNPDHFDFSHAPPGDCPTQVR
jgi:quercetin dioxygenase-like cupin family protein